MATLLIMDHTGDTRHYFDPKTASSLHGPKRVSGS